MDAAEEPLPPVVYTMENKPIVTCECPRAPGPAASWSGGVAGLLPPGLPPPPGAPAAPRGALRHTAATPGQFRPQFEASGTRPGAAARNGGRRARLSPGLESRPSARIGLLPGVLGSAGRGSRSGKLPPATAASPSTPAVVHRHRQCRPARRARSALLCDWLQGSPFPAEAARRRAARPLRPRSRVHALVSWTACCLLVWGVGVCV